MRIGTRGSALALAQANWVAERLDGAEVVVLRTSGDAGRAAGDKSRWVDAIEDALVRGDIDLAVHSAKDVPGELAGGTAIVAVPPREDAADVMVGDGRRVGTSSLRRRAQLLAHDPGREVVELRGNVDTRLRKLAAGEVDALVLAAAGLRRLGRDEGQRRLDHELFVPAPGQGCLAIQGRAGDDRAAALDDPAAHAALDAERAAVRVLEATCHTPVGVHAGGGSVRGFVGRPDGSAWVLDAIDDLDGERLARRMLAAGAREILA
ncbi:MAG TPA: hydroxymethylbilane synthase [Solirubrobacteraceae bacterium]|nr:hydroxymethylbilane synthase [Solirubrobacteraceae bacterium]